MSLGLLYVLLGCVCSNPWPIFLIGLLAFLEWSCVSPFIFWRSNPFQRYHWQICFPHSWCLFHFVDISLAVHKLLFWWDPICLFFPLYPLLLGIYWWKYCCMEYLKFSCLCFPLRLLWCHDLYLSHAHLDYFGVWYNLVVKFHFFACACPDLPTPFIEEAIFTPFYVATPFTKY